MSSKPVTLVSMYIEGLFGLFNHEIPFHTDEPLTIIHGPNGIGKTTVLKIIRWFFTQRFDRLASVPFDSITLKFSDRGTINITFPETDAASKRRERPRYPTRPLTFEYSKSGMKKKQFKYLGKHDKDPEISFFMRHAEEYLPYLERVSQRFWVDRRTGKRFTWSEVMEEYADALPPSLRERSTQVPSWLQSVAESVPVHFIETQRLLAHDESQSHSRHYSNDPLKPTVETYAEQMAQIIQKTLARSASQSQSLDRTFAGRVLKGGHPKQLRESDLRKDYNAQLQKRDRLMKVGVLAIEEPVELPRRDLEPVEEKVLWHYLSDATQKLEVFDNLLSKLELLTDLVNDRFLYKSMQIDRTDGFVFKTDAGQKVPLSALSSGEQHELVLAFALLFRVEAGSMILIDEPEISLHVTWQQRFLDDLLRIAKLSDLSFLVATHSPQIIHDRWNLAVALAEDV